MRRSLRHAALSTLLVAGCATTASHSAGTSPEDAHGAAAASTRYDGSSPEADIIAELRRAIRLMDAGDIPSSIALLEALRPRAPHNHLVLHELALAYRLAEQPARAVELLASYEANLTKATAALYGSALDEAGQTEEAELALRRGLERHPSSGLLYSELGTTLAAHGRRDEAVEVYQRGMAAEPTRPTNYLHAANSFANSRSGGMTLYWGEVFRVLEPDSPRSAAMAETMLRVLRRNVSITSGASEDDTSIHVRLAPGAAPVTSQPDGTLAIPFVFAFEQEVGIPLGVAFHHGVTLARLHAARLALLEQGSLSSTELFRWLAELTAAGHLPAYDHWLFGPAFPEEAEAWAATHGSEREALRAYLDAHAFRPTSATRIDQPVPVRGE